MSGEKKRNRLEPLRGDSIFGESTGLRKPPSRTRDVKSRRPETRSPTWPYLIILLLSVALSALAMWCGVMYSQLRAAGVWSQQSQRADSLLTPPAVFPSDKDVVALHAQPTEIFLYFTADGLKLQPVTMELKRTVSDAQRLRMSLENLLRGPVGSAWQSALPSGVRLRAVYQVEREIVIDLSNELASQPQGGAHAEWLCVQSLVCTALNNARDAQQVRLLISGRPARVLWSEIDLSQPFLRDESLVAY